MRVLITGAGGFIGSHLVDDQLARGREVTALDINTDRLRPLAGSPRLKILEGDFANPDLPEPGLGDHDICFHLASAHLETDVSDAYFWSVNVENTLAFVKRCQAAGLKRFVHCSSVGVYGDIENPPADEDSECLPEVAYEKSKLAGERAVVDFAREAGYDLVVLRPAWVYGPRDPRTERLFRTIAKGRFFYVGDGRKLRHPIYIADMVEAFEIAAKHSSPPGEVYIIAGPRAVTLEELAREIAKCVGVKAPTLKLPLGLVWAGCVVLEAGSKITGMKAPFTRRSLKFYTGNTAFSIEKARTALGFNPKVDLEEGLERTYHWLQQEGKLPPSSAK
jgi:nucleoside-diphosphate-sugar epimerase